MPYSSITIPIDPALYTKTIRYAQPKEVGCMSRDADMQWHFDDDSKLRCLVAPPPECKLKLGFSTYIAKNDDEERQRRLDPILRYLKHCEGKPAASVWLESSDITFITWRGSLSKIMITPYESEAWCFRACREKNRIYLIEDELESARQARLEQAADPVQAMNMYMGYKFEQFATAARDIVGDKEKIAASHGEPVNTCECFCTVIKSQLGGFNVIMAGETDCCLPGADLTAPAKYVELKTSKVIVTSQDQYKFERYKLLKFWAQSFLPGVPRIVVGFHEDGIVKSVEEFDTLRIPSTAKQHWSGSACLAFLHQIFERILAGLLSSSRTHIITIRHEKNSKQIEIKHQGDPFLPDWL